MNSLSSGYAASANRSMSNVTSQPASAIPVEPSASPAPAPALDTKPVAAAAAATRSRVLAPPPAQYVSAPMTTESSLNPSEPKGKMLYGYQAQGDDEVTVQEGDSIAILEPDGKFRRR